MSAITLIAENAKNHSPKPHEARGAVADHDASQLFQASNCITNAPNRGRSVMENSPDTTVVKAVQKPIMAIIIIIF